MYCRRRWYLYERDKRGLNVPDNGIDRRGCRGEKRRGLRGLEYEWGDTDRGLSRKRFGRKMTVARFTFFDSNGIAR